MSGDFGGVSLLELFRLEAESHCQALADGLLELERRPEDVAPIEALMRAAHSIKGAARIVGLDAVVTLAHAMEDFFIAAQQGRERIHPARVDQLLRCVDLLQELRGLAESGLAEWNAAQAERIALLAEGLRAPVGSGAEDVPGDGAGARPAGTEASPAAPDAGEAVRPPPSSSPGQSPRQEPSVAAPAPVAPAAPGPAAGAAPSAGDAVRVAAGAFSRMLHLAGAAKVDVGRLHAVRVQLGEALTRQRRLESAWLSLREAMAKSGAGERLDAPLAELQEAVDGLRDGLARQAAALDEAARRLEQRCGELHRAVLEARLRPFSEGVSGFPRMVRDIARELGKQVELRLQGESTLVDRDILQKLDAPLTHMLRNSLDHGVETPQERAALGKPARATVMLSARHQGGMLLVELRDDGRGIDAELVRRRIVERGLVDEATAARLTVPEVMDFLFLPGFSTREQASELSGRGVGLDVVRAMVQSVGGAISVESAPGRGSRFELRLPVALSVVRAAIADVGDAALAFPLARLGGIVSAPASELTTVQGRLQLLHDGQPVGLLHAADVLETGGDPRPGDPVTVLLIGAGEERCGLIVDRLRGEEDLAVRPLDPRLGAVPHVAAAAVRADGRPVLVVDVEDLARSLRQALSGGRLRGPAGIAAAGARRRRRILVVDDSITVREVERQLLIRAGHEVETAVDGKDGYNALRTGRHDLLVTDVDMPRMNGIELVRAVRRDPRLASLPIVIVSYKDREEDRQAGFEAGANAYLTKSSFHDDTFTQTVDDLLTQHAAGAAPPDVAGAVDAGGSA